MIPLLTLLLPMLAGVIGKFIPDPAKAAEAQADLQKALVSGEADLQRAIADMAKGQTDTNLAEAASPSLFVSGWRPFVGWVCGVACLYAFLAQPLLAWLAGLVGVAIAAAIPVPPTLEMGTLIGLLSGLLGLGGFRTVEKLRGVDRIR